MLSERRKYTKEKEIPEVKKSRLNTSMLFKEIVCNGIIVEIYILRMFKLKVNHDNHSFCKILT